MPIKTCAYQRQIRAVLSCLLKTSKSRQWLLFCCPSVKTITLTSKLELNLSSRPLVSLTTLMDCRLACFSVSLPRCTVQEKKKKRYWKRGIRESPRCMRQLNPVSVMITCPLLGTQSSYRCLLTYCLKRVKGQGESCFWRKVINKGMVQ